jgi:hypothetical protein
MLPTDTTDERWPVTLEEWQRAADAASALLVIDAVRLQPLPGNPRAVEIDRARCEEVLTRAREEHGIEPKANALGKYVAERAMLGVPPDPDADLRGLAPRQ